MGLEIIQINDDMYVIHNEFVPSNVTVLVTDEGVLLIDYAGGGSIRAWTRTLDDVLMLGFETVVPGHGVVTDRAALEEFRGTVAAMRARAREMIGAENSREEIEAMLREEFYWQDLHLTMGFDGLLAEMR